MLFFSWKSFFSSFEGSVPSKKRHTKKGDEGKRKETCILLLSFEAYSNILFEKSSMRVSFPRDTRKAAKRKEQYAFKMFYFNKLLSEKKRKQTR